MSSKTWKQHKFILLLPCCLNAKIGWHLTSSLTPHAYWLHSVKRKLFHFTLNKLFFIIICLFVYNFWLCTNNLTKFIHYILKQIIFLLILNFSILFKQKMFWWAIKHQKLPFQKGFQHFVHIIHCVVRRIWNPMWMFEDYFS